MLKTFKEFIEEKYKWRPSKSQAKEFALKMQDPSFKEEYYEKKRIKQEKNREQSKFDYSTAGGKYIPTETQWKAASIALIYSKDLTKEERLSCELVRMGYENNEKVNHDNIHIVNGLIRNNRIKI